MQPFEYRSVRYWSRESNGTRTEGQKRKFFSSRPRAPYGLLAPHRAAWKLNLHQPPRNRADSSDARSRRWRGALKFDFHTGAEATHALEAREAELEAARYCWRGLVGSPTPDAARRLSLESPASAATEPSPPRHTPPTPTEHWATRGAVHVAPPATEYRPRSPRMPSSDESFGRRTHRSYQEIHAPPAPRTTPTNPAQPLARGGVRTSP